MRTLLIPLSLRHYLKSICGINYPRRDALSCIFLARNSGKHFEISEPENLFIFTCQRCKRSWSDLTTFRTFCRGYARAPRIKEIYLIWSASECGLDLSEFLSLKRYSLHEHSVYRVGLVDILFTNVYKLDICLEKRVI